jgi:dTDP-glucose 4,6-dehydratase
VYDEAKRYAEAATMAFKRARSVEVRIARIFNTYGPRMRRGDGRAVPTFIQQALAGERITVHGDGTQTRSLCFVDDLIEGLFRLLVSDEIGPVNIGNSREITMDELARRIVEIAGGDSELLYVERPVDDPDVRRPDISLARRTLGWEPVVDLDEGLRRTVEWARSAWVD